MTKLAVVAFPKLTGSDRQWIESVRTQHDPQTNLIAVHFTVVFPAEADPDALIGRATSVSRRSQRILFCAQEVLAVPDVTGEGGRVFLLPGVGSSNLVALHRQLSDEATESREFVPHMTVAAGRDFKKCAELARRLSAMNRSVEGSVESLDVVVVSANEARSMATLQLRAEA